MAALGLAFPPITPEKATEERPQLVRGSLTEGSVPANVGSLGSLVSEDVGSEERSLRQSRVTRVKADCPAR